MVKILRYVSDLHLELRPTIEHPKLLPLWDFKISKDDQYYLALLGDIGNPFNDNLKLFLEKVSPKYKKIFYIAGNHEYYNYNVDPIQSKNQFDHKLEKLCKNYDNVYFLNNKTVDLDEIKIIGSTLWSNIPLDNSMYISQYLNDYHMIKNDDLTNITTADTNRWNQQAITFIQNEINNSSYPCIVLTHHAPIFCNSLLKQYTANPIYLNSKLKYAFNNNLNDLLQKPVSAWLYGHTHYTSNFKYNNDVTIATNQLGYLDEEDKINFNPYAYIDLAAIELDSL